MAYSKNSVTSFELPLSESLCVFASSDVFEDDAFFVDGSRAAATILSVFCVVYDGLHEIVTLCLYRVLVGSREGQRQDFDFQEVAGALFCSAITKQMMVLDLIIINATMFPGD